MNPYYTAFLVAIEAYEKQRWRGYYPGFFTTIRHKSHATPYQIHRISALNSELNKLDDDKLDNLKEARIIIHEFFTTGTFNNHSFNSYFIDALHEKFPNESWRNYHRKESLYLNDEFLRAVML